jgi:hypothetical protein
MSLAAGGAHRERTSRHHRDTVQAINDGGRFWGESSHALETPEFRFLTVPEQTLDVWPHLRFGRP